MKKNQLHKTIDNPHTYERMLALYINIMMLLDMFRRIFILMNRSFVYDSQVQATLYIILFIYMFITKYRKIYKLTYVVVFGVLSCFIFLYSFIMDHQVGSILVNSLLNYFTLVFGTCIFIKEIEDPKIFIDSCRIYIYISLLYCVLVLSTQSKQEFAIYSMSFSFNCFFPIGLSLVLAFFENKKSYLIFAGAELAINMMIGSRSILIYSLMILACVYFYLSRKKYYGLKIILAVLLVYLVFDYESIMKTIGSVLLKYIPNSRTVSLLAGGRLFLLSGREKYYSIIEAGIKANPFAVHGVLTDRILIGNTLGHTSYVTEYPHNIFLEILYQHGVIIGSALLIFLTISIIKTVKTILGQKERGRWNMALLIIAFSYAVCQLLVSNSYLIAMSFGLLVGVVLNIISKKEYRGYGSTCKG